MREYSSGIELQKGKRAILLTTYFFEPGQITEIASKPQLLVS